MIQTCIHVDAYIHTHACEFTYVHMHVYVCMFVTVCLYASIACLHACMFVWLYVIMHACMLACISWLAMLGMHVNDLSNRNTLTYHGPHGSQLVRTFTRLNASICEAHHVIQRTHHLHTNSHTLMYAAPSPDETPTRVTGR